MSFRNVIILSAEWCYNRFSIRIGPRIHSVELYIDISMKGMCYGATVTRLQARWPRKCISFLAWVRDSSLLQSIKTNTGMHSVSY